MAPSGNAERSLLDSQAVERAVLIKRCAIAVAAVSIASGLAATVFAVAEAFQAVQGEGIDPARKAEALGEGISQAMNFSLLSAVIWIPSGTLAWVLARKIKRQRARRGEALKKSGV